VQQVYGMTELSGASTHDFAIKTAAGSVGTKIRWSNSRSSRQPTAYGPWPSPVGELLTRGPQVFSGLCRQEANRKTPSSGWLRTGDICRIDADGFVYIMAGQRTSSSARTQYRSARDRGRRLGFLASPSLPPWTP